MADGKLFALVCHNKLFIKPTEAGRTFIHDVVEAPPYPGARLYLLIEDKIEDRDWISELVRITVRELPAPKPKKRKTAKRLFNIYPWKKGKINNPTSTSKI